MGALDTIEQSVLIAFQDLGLREITVKWRDVLKRLDLDVKLVSKTMK
jgi:hypothetical protein